jgi:hypothetical protein
LAIRPHHRGDIMTQALSGIVAEHIRAVNASDTNAIVATFAQDAYVTTIGARSSGSMRSGAGSRRKWSAIV